MLTMILMLFIISFPSCFSFLFYIISNISFLSTELCIRCLNQYLNYFRFQLYISNRCPSLRVKKKNEDFYLFFLTQACSPKKTKEVSASVIVSGQRAVAQRSQSCLCHRTAEQGGQWCHADTDSEEDRRQDRDSAQWVRGHHDYRGVHRSG